MTVRLRHHNAAEHRKELAEAINSVQTVTFQTGDTASTTTTVPFDNTIPQNDEGGEFMTLSITPNSATNKLVIEVDAFLNNASASQWVIGALFQDTTADALASAMHFEAIASGGRMMRIRYEMTSGTTSSTTFKFRAGRYTGGAGTLYFNGDSVGQRLGGSMASNITITEYRV